MKPEEKTNLYQVTPPECDTFSVIAKNQQDAVNKLYAYLSYMDAPNREAWQDPNRYDVIYEGGNIVL